MIQIRVLKDVLSVLTQKEIGGLYSPRISQQAVQQWFDRGRVPPRRIPRLVKALKRRGCHIPNLGVLNPEFRSLSDEAA